MGGKRTVVKRSSEVRVQSRSSRIDVAMKLYILESFVEVAHYVVSCSKLEGAAHVAQIC